MPTMNNKTVIHQLARSHGSFFFNQGFSTGPLIRVEGIALRFLGVKVPPFRTPVESDNSESCHDSVRIHGAGGGAKDVKLELRCAAPNVRPPISSEDARRVGP
jgi:hypothetical protein